MSEWDRRLLCPDGSCIGVIGPDGRCKVCGRAAPNWGEERKRGLAEEEADDEPAEQEAEPADEIAPSAPAALGAATEWTKRQLCGDGGCIGVIGADRRCKVCGRTLAESAAGAPPVPVPAPDEDDDDDLVEEDDEDDDEEGEDGDDDGDDDEDADEDEEDAQLEAAAAELAPVVVADELANRTLCSDGACVGVIGPDGRCKVCGKEAA